MSENGVVGVILTSIVTGVVIIASLAMVSATNIDFSTAAKFVFKNVSLLVVLGALVFVHMKSVSDPWSSYSSSLYWYGYALIIAVHFLTWWPVIRFTNLPDFVDSSRFLEWYQSYTFLSFCFVALLVGLYLLTRKIIEDWAE